MRQHSWSALSTTALCIQYCSSLYLVLQLKDSNTQGIKDDDFEKKVYRICDPISGPSIEANIIGLLSHPTLENSFLFNNNSVQVRLNFYCPSVCPSVCLSHFTFHFSLDNDRETAYFFLFSLPKQRETDKLFSFHFPRNGKPYRISLFTSQKAGTLFFLLFSLPKKREIYFFSLFTSRRTGKYLFFHFSLPEMSKPIPVGHCTTCRKSVQ